MSQVQIIWTEGPLKGQVSLVDQDRAEAEYKNGNAAPYEPKVQTKKGR